MKLSRCDEPIKQSQTSNGEWLLGMTTWEEQAYFENYARSVYTGAGVIVDLGCWLGSTTISLARGLDANSFPHTSGKKIHAYDLFRWETWMDEYVKGTDLEARYQPAESFLEEFKNRTAPWADQIQIYTADLRTTPWNDQDIEFLLIDAMKSWELGSAIARNFYPSSIPKKSYVLHQDFAHWHESWIHLIQYRLRNYFRFVHAVPRSDSFVLCTHQLPRELFTAAYNCSSFTTEEIECAFDYSMSLAPDGITQARIALAKVVLFIHMEDRPTAKLELERYLSRGYTFVPDLQRVQDQLRGDS